MARTITHNRAPDWEDLLSEVVLILLESNEDRLNALIERKQIRYWIARIMLNQYNSSSSPFHYKYRVHASRHRAGALEIRLWHEDNLADMMLKETRLEDIEQALSEIDWFDQMVTRIYYQDKHSLNSLSRATGISRTTLYKALKRTRHAIQKKVVGTR